MFSLFQVQIKSCACTGLFGRIVWLCHPHTEWRASHSLAPSILCLLPTEIFLCNWGKEEFSPGDAPCWSQLHHCPAAAEEGFMTLHTPMQPPLFHFKAATHKSYMSLCLSCLCLSHCFGAYAAAQHSLKCSVPREDELSAEPSSVSISQTHRWAALCAHLLQLSQTGRSDQRLDTGNSSSSQLHLVLSMWSRCIL